MSDLTFMEKNKIEKILDMGGGYVLDFSNRSLSEFVADAVSCNIYDKRYEFGSGSKANLLRRFFAIEPNHLVGRLLRAFLEYIRETNQMPVDDLYADCQRIVDRLLAGAPVLDIHVLTPPQRERTFDTLVNSIRQAINDNKPETALDRLHTYVVKYLRTVCQECGISTPREKSLHSLLGEYVSYLKRTGRIESIMTERILKSNISTMEAFNNVRNERSLAHDNPILNYHESLLIVDHVICSIRFLQSLDQRTTKERSPVEAAVADDVPF